MSSNKGIIYGPINSRRLGWSLGINLFGNKKKICSLNCKYCERGWTDLLNNKFLNSRNFPEVLEVVETLENTLDDIRIKPEYLTFSGNGEPTLYPRFSEIVDEVVKIRNRKLPETKIAILSNSTTLDNNDVIYTLEKFDERIMKLDVGNEKTFRIFNSPIKNITLEEVIIGLKKLKNITIQSLFAGGNEGNYKEKNLEDWLEMLKIINPNYVQIYTIDRSYPSNNIYPIGLVDLKYIELLLKKHKIRAGVYF